MAELHRYTISEIKSRLRSEGWAEDEIGHVLSKPKSIQKILLQWRRVDKIKKKKEENPSHILKKLRKGIKGHIKLVRGKLIIKT